MHFALTHCSSADDGSHLDAGWSSSVARWAHNPEVVGSNPAPATNFRPLPVAILVGVFFFLDNVVRACISQSGVRPILGKGSKCVSGSACRWG